jgi:hypothetical protein
MYQCYNSCILMNGKAKNVFLCTYHHLMGRVWGVPWGSPPPPHGTGPTENRDIDKKPWPNLQWLNLERPNLKRLNVERPNVERPNIEWDRTSKDWTSNGTEHWKTERRMGPNVERLNFERLNLEWDRTSKDWTSKRTEHRKTEHRKGYITVFSVQWLSI